MRKKNFYGEFDLHILVSKTVSQIFLVTLHYFFYKFLNYKMVFLGLLSDLKFKKIKKQEIKQSKTPFLDKYM